MNELNAAERHRVVGWVMVVIGVLGVVTGVVPLAINGLRVVGDEHLWGAADVAAHGVEAMGLSIEWAMLSAAMGACLGVLMVWAGVGWIRGRAWAGTVSWTYVLAGVTVNVCDLLIFAFRAKAGAMRNGMLAADSVALVIPLVLGVWLVNGRRA